MPEFELKLLRSDEVRPGMWVECYKPIAGEWMLKQDAGSPLGWRVVTQVVDDTKCAGRLVLWCGEGIVSTTPRTVLLVGCEKGAKVTENA